MNRAIQSDTTDHLFPVLTRLIAACDKKTARSRPGLAALDWPPSWKHLYCINRTIKFGCVTYHLMGDVSLRGI
jgi:hypothetical protein